MGRAIKASRLYKIMAIGVLLLFLLVLLGWYMLTRDLPDAEMLLEYEPPLPTIVRANDGEPVHSFARERRILLDYKDLPSYLVRAFLAAEDRSFFTHGGLDYPGIASAFIGNLTRDGRPIGASTITQQVAKNILLNNELSYIRKLKEAVLALRIEDALTKEQILMLYLNEIALGRRSYGVQAASYAYFQKDVADLELHEMAFLAILPKAPEVYGRVRHADRAIARRNFVLEQMYDNDFIEEAEYMAARAKPLGLKEPSSARHLRYEGYFIEEVRRQLIEQYGENEGDGANSVYSGGLWVRSSLDRKLQQYARGALRGGIMRYERGKKWSGPINTMKVDGQWAKRLASTFIRIDYDNWRIAVVLKEGEGAYEIGFSGGNIAAMAKGDIGLNIGDIIAVSPVASNQYRLERFPEISGAMVVQNPHSGRVLAMQGGFDFGISSFNRATQANRHPGSTIKPFVYATALDHGMTPTTLIEDSPFCVYQSATLGRKCFRNYGNARGAGKQTLRWGVEQSRNLMTVRAANEVGMDNVVATIDRLGIGRYSPWLSFALGAGETTVQKITNAYSVLINHGRALRPSLIDYVQDRRGKVIWRADERDCYSCNMAEWDGGSMPRPVSSASQVLNPMTAYQMVHILEGVVQRGTAQSLRSLSRPLMGKTGTSSGPKDVWFVGGTPDLVAGVYMGYDQPRDMGRYAQGGSLAAPIFKDFAAKALTDMAPRPFTAPRGIRMVRIDRRTGRRAFGGWPTHEPKAAVIWEAFKPETEPRRTVTREDFLNQLAERRQRALDAAFARAEAARASRSSSSGPRNDEEFFQEADGIY